ncbi:MAG: hypothetical protein K0Q72_5063 [Armatimonadetes bacterium]|jgi:hypothetical protein|nr:hypothetical protein [Armatimonadota bacterium]
MSTITETSRRFFQQVVLPVLERELPVEAGQAAFGLFGYGSEAYGLDDGLSRDHHWGLRVDALLPDLLLRERRDAITAAVSAALPPVFEGFPLREGHVAGSGVALDSLEGFLTRTLGSPGVPTTWQEWLRVPEEDIHHVTNGEVWHDASGRFSAVRETLGAYYPDPVWRRRIAHWCRYYSGMGSYALKRALLRGNELYAVTAFGKAIRWGIQLAFLLDRRYFPYDKWLMVHFERLPRLHTPLRSLVDEAVRLSTGWERKLELLDAISDVLDGALVADGLIRPHPRFTGSATSGYRLLEHAYAELLQGLPAELQDAVPVWDQVYLEEFHSRYVSTLSMTEWDRLLCLTPDSR